ncbi:MAG TPA: GGDEF domain-containing protein [Candidatus Baltobacteraceae bacterium]|nr:GGDEF domain-containing protein [Candidatus Baltobacteraceae bacterium]
MTRNLRVYTAFQIVLGFGALVLVSWALPVESAVGIASPRLSPEVNQVLGVAFWVVLALAGSALFVQRPEGGVVTLDLPFVVAATVLGGPVAGGWVAMVGSFELRELRAPWYGVLANHAMATLPAVVAGLVWLDLGPWLANLVSFSPATQYLVAALLAAAIVVLLGSALAVESLALRSGRSFREVAAEFGLGYRVTMAAEAVVAWLMVVVYLSVGWWAPIVCLIAIFAIWHAYGADSAEQSLTRDAMTGLLNADAFGQRLEDAMGRAGRRRKARVAIIRIDLNEFRRINDRYGHDIGDEVLRRVGRRIRGAIRTFDLAARLAKDDFVVLLLDVPDGSAAQRIAGRIHGEITRPMKSSGAGTIEIGASLGVAVGSGERRRPGDGGSAAEPLLGRASLALHRAQRSGGGIYVDDEES